MTDWDSPEAKALLRQERTAKARQARRRNVLERKAGEYAAALRELGYTVIEPDAPLPGNPYSFAERMQERGRQA